jgi:uncharacterized membrane protein
MPYAAGESAIREAGLDPQPEDSLFVTVLALASLALLLLLALYARSHWDRIPDVFPVHFGFRRPERWVTRSPSAVYGLIGLSALLCVLMLMVRYGNAALEQAGGHRWPSARAEARFRRLIAWLLVAVAVVLAMGMVVLAVMLVFVLLRVGLGGNRAAPSGTVPQTHSGSGACSTSIRTTLRSSSRSALGSATV